MISTITKPLPILISLIAMSGVFMHDTQFDKAIVTAVVTPAIISDYEAELDKLSSSGQHIHPKSSTFSSSTFSLRSPQPATQPKSEHEKKFIAQRRLVGSGFGNDYCWPSI